MRKDAVTMIRKWAEVWMERSATVRPGGGVSEICQTEVVRRERRGAAMTMVSQRNKKQRRADKGEEDHLPSVKKRPSERGIQRVRSRSSAEAERWPSDASSHKGTGVWPFQVSADGITGADVDAEQRQRSACSWTRCCSREGGVWWGGRRRGRLRHHGPYEDDSYEMLLTAYLGMDLHYTLTKPDI